MGTLGGTMADERDEDAPFPGESPETLDDLRQECSLLRRRVESLEADKGDLAAQVAAWKKWYVQNYRPQIEYLDSEVSRLCALAPVLPDDGYKTGAEANIRKPPAIVGPPDAQS